MPFPLTFCKKSFICFDGCWVENLCALTVFDNNKSRQEMESNCIDSSCSLLQVRNLLFIKRSCWVKSFKSLIYTVLVIIYLTPDSLKPLGIIFDVICAKLLIRKYLISTPRLYAESWAELEQLITDSSFLRENIHFEQKQPKLFTPARGIPWIQWSWALEHLKPTLTWAISVGDLQNVTVWVVLSVGKGPIRSLP